MNTKKSKPHRDESYHHNTKEIKDTAFLVLIPFVAFCLLGLCLFSSFRVISSYCTSILVSLIIFFYRADSQMKEVFVIIIWY